MTKYIDTKYIENFKWDNVGRNDFLRGWNMAVDAMLLDAPVVEVVQCKNCEYSYDSIGGWVCSHGPCVDCIVPEDFFCKYGKYEELK